MPADLTLTVLAGGTAGLGAALLVRELLPAQPHLAAALDRLTTPRPGSAPVDQEPVGDDARTRSLEIRAGAFVQRHLAGLPFVAVPVRELALLQISGTRHLGQKVLLAAVGLLFPLAFTILAAAAGFSLPLAFPAVSALALGALLFLAPDLEVRHRAAEAREEFARATSAYIDLTALERAAGAGATQALEQAATVGDSWVFVRLREQLTRARLSGTAPWDGLHELATELSLPELSDLADIMRLSGEEGAAVADTLRARSRGLRAALLTREQTRANEDSERMVVPVAVLGLIFLCLLGAPAIVRIL